MPSVASKAPPMWCKTTSQSRRYHRTLEIYFKKLIIWQLRMLTDGILVAGGGAMMPTKSSLSPSLYTCLLLIHNLVTQDAFGQHPESPEVVR